MTGPTRQPHRSGERASPEPAGSTAPVPETDTATHPALSLQRLVGNQAVQRLIRARADGIDAHRAIAAPSTRISRQPAPGGASRGPTAAPSKRDRVVNSQTEDRARTLVQVHVTGHASPRWRSARSAREADRRNAELSEQRAQAARREVEAMIRDALPDHQLDFRYDYTPIDPRNEAGGVIVGTDSRGSQQTLGEAGKRGRSANDPAMRRVDVAVTLSSFIASTRTQEIARTREKSGATRDWAIQVAFQAGAQAGGGAGYIVAKLKNRTTNQDVIGHGWYGKGGLGADFSLGASVDWGGLTNFRTKEPAVFSDFEWINFSIRTHGGSIGIIGYEWAELTLFDLPGGYVDGIDIGGSNSGKFGLDLYSRSYGALALEGTPSDTYDETSKETQVDQFESSSVESHQHPVTFPTGEWTVDDAQQKRLWAYVRTAVQNYEEGER